METNKFEGLKKLILKCKENWYEKDILAEIYNLWQEHMITEAQETELYEIADPEEKFNNPAEYWFDDKGCLPIWQYANEEV